MSDGSPPPEPGTKDRSALDPVQAAELDRLLDAALDLRIEERAAWLETLEPRHAPLRPLLREVLARAARIETSQFLDTLPKLSSDHLDDETDTDNRALGAAGETVGPYRLVRELGSGGMASVWLAERTDGLFDRRVALKLPHVSRHRAGLAERMAREREVLATLEHPNIARLYEAGMTAEGQPFLAIEYVDGKPIDEYCRDRKLDVRASVALFLQAARAVAYAHGKLAIHRDLKPANILVTPDGTVKLLDFGIAKLLEGSEARSTHLTELFGRALTPDYASPEQIAGEPITIASDVYSLGVVLYELVARTRPYKLKRGSLGALEEAILAAEPAPPSDAATESGTRKALRGDLDTVLLKALKKRPSERYSTVNAFVDDLERYLSDRPVLARPDSVRYRTAKFLRRNKLGVGVAAALLMTVLAGSAAALWQARAAVAEQRRAEEVKEFLASTLRGADPYQGSGGVPSVVELLREASERASGLTERPELRVELLTLIGSSLLNLEDLDAAENAAREALDESLARLGASHELTLHARVLMLGVHRFRGRTAEMRGELDAVDEILRGRPDVSPEEQVIVLESRAHLSIDDGDSAAAVASAQQALDFALATFGERDARTATAATLLAESYEYSDVSAETALAAAERAFGLTTAIYGEESRHPRMISVRDVYGRALARAAQLEEGVRQLERALEDAQDVFGPQSASVGFMAANLARYQRARGDIDAAIANLDLTLEIHGRDVERTSFTYLSPLTARGIALIAARRTAAAERDLSEASEGMRALLGAEHEETLIAEWQRALALAYEGRAAEAEAAFAPVVEQYRTTYADPVYLPSNVLAAAGTALRLAGDLPGALALQEEALAAIGPGVNAERLRIPIATELGLLNLELERPDEAVPLLDEALTLLAKYQPRTTPARTDLLVGLGRARLALGDAESALAPLEEADAFWRDFDPQNHFAGEAAFWLASAYAGLARRDDAAAAFERARDILSQSPPALAGRWLAAIPE